MARPAQAKSSDEIFAEPIHNVVPITIVVNRSMATGDANPYSVRNQAFVAKKKRAILYKNGYTLPASAATLLAEAEREIDHSKKLGRNLRRANPGSGRPKETDAHHVVAREAAAAHPSRVLIFNVGIGINDADNGVILPRSKATRISGLPNATPHQNVHTTIYHANVVAELYGADDVKNPKEIRDILRSIARRLLNGQFTF